VQPAAYFITVIDADPKKTGLECRDTYLLKKYRFAMDFLRNAVGGKAAVCVHTSPRYRDRFFQPAYLAFWRQWGAMGGELLLHPEEDGYQDSLASAGTAPRYLDRDYIKGVILSKIHQMKEQGLEFSAFRGGFFGMTEPLADILWDAGIRADLSAAPGLHRPERAVDWRNASETAYFTSPGAYLRPAAEPLSQRLFEIPLGWDGLGVDLGRNYLFHERSNFRRLSRVWDRVIERAASRNRCEIVYLLCHTYSMFNTRMTLQLEEILAYMQENSGRAVSIEQARKIYEHRTVWKSGLPV